MGTILVLWKVIKLCCALFLAFFWSLLPPDAHHPRMRINPGWGRYQTLLLGFKSSIFLWYKHIPKFSNQSASFYTLIITCQGHISDVSVLFEFLNWCFQTSWKSCDNNHDNNEDSVDDDSLNCLWRYSGTATFNLTILIICKDFSKLIFFLPILTNLAICLPNITIILYSFCETHTNQQLSNNIFIYAYYGAKSPIILHIFEEMVVQGYQKLYSHVSNMQIQKYKYTNT